MKKLILLITAVLAAFALSAAGFAAYDPDVDYLDVMIDAAASGDLQAGYAAEAARREKIEALGLDSTDISFDDLYLLSKIIYAEAGSEWLSDEWKMCVGEVVLNRVASPEFPDTIEDVIYQSGQYYSRSSTYFANLRPSERCVDIAVDLLMGERYLNDSSVVFQANFVQGSGICQHFYDRYLGSTYFCYSSKPWLYEQEETTEEPVEEEPAEEGTVEEDLIDEETAEDEFDTNDGLQDDETAIVEDISGQDEYEDNEDNYVGFVLESVTIEALETLKIPENLPAMIVSFD